MKKLLSVVLLALMFINLGAQKANVVYTEGKAQIKSSSGSLREADFGSKIVFGESIITGKDGLVEIKLENGSTIRVSSNSVFSYSSTGTGSETQSVLATTAGSVSYKLAKVTGKSPVIQTNSMVAGVRGTEFTVFAGRDGSVLLAVTEGVVDVEAQDQMVVLYKDEAVEVAPGKAPGEKYIWLGKELDFSSWNQQKNDDFLANPLAGLEAVEKQLESYKKELLALKAPYQDATQKWRIASEEYKKMIDSSDPDTLKEFQKLILSPAENERSALILNIRYYALNYLSVRRYVLSNMYMEIKSRNPINPNEEVLSFYQKHKSILSSYEDSIVPELNKNDY